MDDEQHKGKVTSNVVELPPMDPRRHTLPPRPSMSLGQLSSAARTTTSSKKDASNRRDSSAHKLMINTTGSVALIWPVEDIERSRSPQIAVAKDEEIDHAPSVVPESQEQEPVAPFWGEEDSHDQMQEQPVATSSAAPSGPKKLAERVNETLLINRISLDARIPPIDAKKSPKVPVGGCLKDSKWKKLSPVGESTGDSQGSTMPLGPRSFTAAGSFGSMPAKLPPTGPNTTRTHREDAGSSLSGKGNRRLAPYPLSPPAPPFQMHRTSGQVPAGIPPTAPRAMRQDTPNAAPLQHKSVNPTAQPKRPDTQPESLVAPVKPELAPLLKVEDPPDSRSADPPKEIRYFQPLTGVKYSATGVSRYLQGVEMGGTALHIREFPICPVQCTLESSAPDDKPYIIRGKMGCTHSASVDVQCLSTTLPKEIPLQHFVVLNFHTDAPTPMARVAPGRSLCSQAVGEQSGGYLQWNIVTDTNVERLSQYFAKKGKSLDSGKLVPEPNELIEAAKTSITIIRCDQRPGEVVYIPPGSWYQITAIGNPMALRVWHAYPLKAVIATDMTRETATFHRMCGSSIPPFRNLLYYHLRVFHRTISDPNTAPIFANKKMEKECAQELTESIKLFDRVLAEEYTMGTREDEPLLEEFGFCDFCGTDILHAAFVCSSKFGLWERSPVPDRCCEVRLCPACCCEGRSCACGNLRLCSVLDYDALVKMRNEIWSWCMSKQQNASASADCAETLTTSDIYEDLRHPHLALGAISILNIRNSLWMEEQGHIDGLHVICKGGALCSEEHEVSRLQSVTCNECHESICFKHLLAAGIHSWEAAFRWGHDRSWHEVHTTWSTQWIEWSKSNDPDPEDLLTTLATSHSFCSPLKPTSVRLGFYDVVDPSINCAKYEDDPILRWFGNKSTAIDSVIPSIELMAPAIKALKSVKRKSVTPGAADLSDTRTPKRKKKNAARDVAFNPKPSGKSGASKASKTKSRLSTSTPVTPVKESDFGVEETDESMDLSKSLILASQMLLPDRMDVSGTLNLEEGGSQSSPTDTVHLGVPISLDTHVLANGGAFSGPPSTSRSSYDYSPEQSSSVITPLELYSANKDEIAVLRQQMEALLRQNKELNRRVQQLQEDKDAELQAKYQEIARLTERLSALEATSSQERPVMPVASESIAPVAKGNLSPISKYVDTRAPASGSESDSDSEIEGNPLVPY